MSKFAYDQISSIFPDAFETRYTDRSGDEWAVVKPQWLQRVASQLKNDPNLGFTLFGSADGIDRLHLPENTPRFEVVYFLYSVSRQEHVRLKVRVAEETPEVPTLTTVFKGAAWWERLVWDFYGIRFVGNTDLRRILLYEEFKGHPLRKDYAMRDRQPLIPERPLRDIFRGPGTTPKA